MMNSNGGLVNHDPGPSRPPSRRVTFDIAESVPVAMEEDDPVLVVLKAKMSQLQICTDCPMDDSPHDSVLFSGTSSTSGPSACPPYCIMNSTDSMGPSPHSRTSDHTETVLPIPSSSRSPLLASKIEQGYRKIKAKAARDAEIEHRVEPAKVDRHQHCRGMKCRSGRHDDSAHSDDEFFASKTDFYEGLFAYSSESEMDRLLSEANPSPRPTSPSTQLAITFGCLELSNSIPTRSHSSASDYRPSSSCRKPPRPTIDPNFLHQLRDYLVQKKRDYAYLMRYKQQLALRINECNDQSSGQNRRYLRKMASKATKLRVERTREIVRRRQKRGLGLGVRGSLDRDPPPPLSPYPPPSPPPPFSTRGGVTCQRSKMLKKCLPRKR